jgi:hypothetical protein
VSAGFGWKDSPGQSFPDPPEHVEFLNSQPLKDNGSRLPVVVGAAALTMSVAMVPFGAGVTSILGYLLTPFAVVFSLAWARASYVRKLDDPWFDRGRALRGVFGLQVLAAAAFLVAIPHVWNLSKVAALWLQ